MEEGYFESHRVSPQMHEGEHGVGGGQQLGFGYVVNYLYFADGGGKNEGADAAAVFLVAAGEGY